MTGSGRISGRILVVDDDAGMRASLVDLLESAGWAVAAAARVRDALARLSEDPPDVILSDLRMPGRDGMDLLAEVQATDGPPVVMISAHGDIPAAVEAVRAGAYSFVEKPFVPERLLRILSHAADLRRLARDGVRLRARLSDLAGLERVLLGETPEIVALRDAVLDAAAVDAPVLIQGETGTGKELVARALHDLGPRSAGPFVALNAATLAPDGFEAEVFGVEGGAPGLVRGAAGGTLFLDELGACPEPAQAKLLRVIETGRVAPLGGAERAVDFRTVAAMGGDPDAAIAAGTLRRDLYYRIAAIALALPPLRARKADLPLLCRHFLDRLARLYEIAPPLLTDADLAALLAHDWPGNVRELRNVAERRVLAARRGRGSIAEAIGADGETPQVPGTLREAVAVFERELIGAAIRANGGRMDAVAESLGIGRRTLNEKIVKLGLEKADWLDGSAGDGA